MCRHLVKTPKKRRETIRTACISTVLKGPPRRKSLGFPSGSLAPERVECDAVARRHIQWTSLLSKPLSPELQAGGSGCSSSDGGLVTAAPHSRQDQALHRHTTTM